MLGVGGRRQGREGAGTWWLRALHVQIDFEFYCKQQRHNGCFFLFLFLFNLIN